MLFLLLFSAISGCTEAATPAEPVTIRFGHPAGDAAYYEDLVRRFNEDYSHITVELESYPHTVFPVPTEGIDVFVTSPFALSDLLEEDAILSIDPFIEQDETLDLSDFYPGTVDLCSREGRLWIVPAGVDVMVMYYNRDLFDAYGVAYPEVGWTWDDFLNSGIALRDRQAGVYGYVAIDSFIDPLPFIYQHGGQILDDMQNPTRTTYDDPLTIEALEWYAALIHEHNVAPTHRQLVDEPFRSGEETGVYAGKVGMWSGFLSERGGGGDVEERWPAAWDMRWGMAPMPRDAQPATLVAVDGYAISSECPQPDACWRWVVFLSQQLQAPYGEMPARRSLAESAEYERLVTSAVADVARESMEDVVMLSPALVEFVSPFIYGSAIDGILRGRSTPLEAMTRAQQQAERQQ